METSSSQIALPISLPDEIFDIIKTYILHTSESKKRKIMREVENFLSSEDFNEEKNFVRSEYFHEHFKRHNIQYVLREKRSNKMWIESGTNDKDRIRNTLLNKSCSYSVEKWANADIKSIKYTYGNCIGYTITYTIYDSDNNRFSIDTDVGGTLTLGRELVKRIADCFLEPGFSY